MVTLAIETSNPSACEGVPGSSPGVAIARGRTVLGVEPIAPEGRHDDALMPAIDRLARRVGIRPKEISRVAVSTGPGGFTALRVAVATAKAMAEAAGARCVAVPSAHVVAASVAGDGEAFLVALNSKHDAAYFALFDAQGVLVGVPVVTARLAEAMGDVRVLRLIADRHLPEALRGQAVALGMRVEAPMFDAAACARLSFDLPDVDPAALVPLYAREPEAVTRWRERKAGS